MRRSLLAAGVVVLLTQACMDVPRYNHEPTRDILGSTALDAPGLKASTVRGVVLSPRLLQGRPRIKLLFVSKEKTNVHLVGVSLDGLDVDVDEDVPVDTKSTKRPEVFIGQHSISLEKLVKPKRFDELGADGFELTVELTDGTVVLDISMTTDKVPSCGGW